MQAASLEAGPDRQAVNVTVAVQHHPSRAALIPGLLERLTGLPTEVVTDPDPDGVPSPWRCYLECLRRVPEKTTHLLVLQDDAVPCDGFAVGLTNAVTARPATPLCAWVGGAPLDLCVALLKASKTGQRFVDFAPYSWIPAVATVWPVGLVRQLVAWAAAEGFDKPKHRSDDALLSKFCQRARVWPAATCPSLVEHPDRELSIIGRRAWAGRQSSRVACVAPPADASLIEW